MPETQIPAQPTPAEGSPVQSAINVDTLLDNYFGSDVPAIPTPKAKTETPVPSQDIPVDQPDPELETEDTTAETVEGEETGTEQEGEETEGTLDEDAEVDGLLAITEEEAEDTPKESFLPEFDRVKFLKEHPDLEPAYKYMQAAFSRKMAALSTTQKKADELTAEAEAMHQQYTTFQESLKNDETFEEFLVQVSLNRPEVMERAYERAVTLNEDEGKKKEYLQGQELKDAKAKLKEQEERAAIERRQTRTTEIVSLTQRVAKKLGLSTPGELAIAEQFVANQILQNVANGGERDIKPEQLVLAVRQAAKSLARQKEDVVKTTKAGVRKENLKAAQDRLRQPARPAPPKGGAPVAGRETNGRISNAPKQQPLERWIDEQLGVEA